MDDFLKNILYYSVKIIKAVNDNSTDDTPETDDDYDEEEESDLFVNKYNVRTWIPSFLVFFGLLIVTLMTKRKRRCPDCADGYFGLAVPVNFLESRKRRKPLLAAFSMTAMAVIGALQAMNVELAGYSNAVKIILKLMLVSMMGCYYLPLFACIYKGTLPACIVGLIYNIISIGIEVTGMFPEPGLSSRALVKELLLRVFVITIAGTFLTFWFVKQILRHYRKEIVVEDLPKNQKKYVASLFLPKEQYLLLNKIGTIDENQGHKVVQLFRKHIYHKIPGFRYSLTILVSCTVGFLIITQFSIVLFHGFIKNRSEVLKLLEEFKVFKDTTIPNVVDVIVKKFTKSAKEEAAGNSTVDSSTISVYDLVYSQSIIILIVSIVSGLTAYAICIISICRLLTSYRTNVLGLSKQKHDLNVLHITDDTSNISVVKSAISFGGYQIAYLIAGFSIQLFSLNVILFILLEVIILPIQFAFWSFLLKILEIALPIIMALILIQLTQYLLIKYFFLEDKGATMALDNRRGFFIMSYFVFFYNIFTGVFSCAKRVFKGAMIGIFLVPRLDTSVFPRIYEKNDSGFKAYSCLLHLEALQSNPVVRTFVYLLSQNLRDLQKVSTDHLEENGVLLEAKVSKRRLVARNKWFVAYTLLRNPTVICFRGLNMLSILEAYAKPLDMQTEENGKKSNIVLVNCEDKKSPLD